MPAALGNGKPARHCCDLIAITIGKQQANAGGHMLIRFKSKAAAEVLMYEEHAKRILDLFGKDIHRGVLTAEEMPQAVQRLEAEIVESRQHPVSDEVTHDVAAHHNAQGDDNEHEPIEIVTFANRAYPLLEMMRAAEKGRNDILWGV
jgi:hypothetical protein